jgi:ADP-ribose pyrophosphatase YjhB (NUDIX family)
MRAQVVLVEGDRILLAGHRRGDHLYWVLPGGAVEPDETPEEAAVREVCEETGLEIGIERLLFVDGPRSEGEILIKRPRYTYLARVVSGDLCVVEDRAGERAEKGYLAGCAWMPFESPVYDAATRDTLRLVRQALGAGGEQEGDRPWG